VSLPLPSWRLRRKIEEAVEEGLCGGLYSAVNQFVFMWVIENQCKDHSNQFSGLTPVDNYAACD
jgi:hypothetical protein